MFFFNKLTSGFRIVFLILASCVNIKFFTLNFNFKLNQYFQKRSTLKIGMKNLELLTDIFLR